MEYEAHELHTRVATWLHSCGFLYIHEYHKKIDFLVIDPKTGQVFIIECKREINFTSSVISQLNEYYQLVGLPSAQRICAAMSPLRAHQREEFTLNDVKWMIFPEAMTKTDCIPTRHSRPAFLETWYRFYTTPIGTRPENEDLLLYDQTSVKGLPDGRFEELRLIEVKEYNSRAKQREGQARYLRTLSYEDSFYLSED